MSMMHSRRRFLATLSSAGAAALIGPARSSAQEAPPETTTIRLVKSPSICIAPQYVAGELLRAEGFTDIRYVPSDAGLGQSAAMARGDVDLAMHFAAPLIIPIDGGEKITVVGGVHVGCFELIATERIRSIKDLKGRAVGVQGLGAATHVFLSTMAAHVGLNPAKDINWVTSPTITPRELFVDGKIDAFLSFPPEPQALRASKTGQVVVNSSVDRPWSQYFCCMLAGNRDFIQKHPIATKRAARHPEGDRLLRHRSDGGGAPHGRRRLLEPVRSRASDREGGALQRWRDYDPDDTLRFYSLRLREAGMIKSTPGRIIAEGTDWRVFQRTQARAEELIVRPALLRLRPLRWRSGSVLHVYDVSRTAPQQPALPKIGAGAGICADLAGRRAGGADATSAARWWL